MLACHPPHDSTEVALLGLVISPVLVPVTAGFLGRRYLFADLRIAVYSHAGAILVRP
jgi:hypothetical protein